MNKYIRNITIYSVAFILILGCIVFEFAISFDSQLQNHAYNMFDDQLASTFFDIITNYTLGTVIGIAGVILLLAVKKHFYALLALCFSFVGLFIAVEGIKHFINRPRPITLNSSITYLGTHFPDGFSFPSGHTTIAFFLCAVLMYKFAQKKVYKFAFLVFAALVGFSRIYLGAHYPFDVFAGALLGLIFGDLAIILDKWLPKKIKIPQFLQ